MQIFSILKHFDINYRYFLKNSIIYPQRNDIVLHMKVEVTRTAKRIVKMRVEDGILKVVAFYFLSERRLRKIISENLDWINSHNHGGKSPVKEQVAPPEKEPSNNFIEERPRSVHHESRVLDDIIIGNKTVILGDVVNVQPSATSKSYLDGDVLYISNKYSGSRETRLKGIRIFLKKMASMYVSDEIANFGSGVSLCPAKIEFRDNDDFWVKCSLAGQRVLCFDYRIVQLPQKLRRYVIAHAFAHFSHPLHDDDFWNFLSDTLPHYKEYAKELEQYRILKEI